MVKWLLGVLAWLAFALPALAQSCDQSIAGMYAVSIRGDGCLSDIDSTELEPFTVTLDTNGCQVSGVMDFFGLRLAIAQTTWSYSSGVLRITDPSGTGSGSVRPAATMFTTGIDTLYPRFRQDLLDFFDEEEKAALFQICGNLDNVIRSVKLDWRLISRPTSPPPGGGPPSGSTDWLNQKYGDFRLEPGISRSSMAEFFLREKPASQRVAPGGDISGHSVWETIGGNANAVVYIAVYAEWMPNSPIVAERLGLQGSPGSRVLRNYLSTAPTTPGTYRVRWILSQAFAVVNNFYGNETGNVNNPPSGYWWESEVIVENDASNGTGGSGGSSEYLELTEDGPLTNLSAAKGQDTIFRFNLEPGLFQAIVQLDGGSGQADVFLNQDAVPTAKLFYKSPTGTKAIAVGKGTAKRIVLASPPAGEWFGLIRSGKSGYSGVNVRLVTQLNDPFAVPIQGKLSFGPLGIDRDDVELGLPSRGSARLDPKKSLWVVTHGRAQALPLPPPFNFAITNSDEVRSMASILSVARPGDNVLFLDWDESANSWVCEGANKTEAVGEWLATQIRAMGISPATQVNLVGHSWGTWVCYFAARSLGRVNSIVALDPAISLEHGCLPPDVAQIDFASVSNLSWSIRSSFWGSETRAQTAKEAFLLNIESPALDVDVGNHSDAHAFFKSILAGHATRSKGAVVNYFNLKRLAGAMATPKTNGSGNFDGSLDAGYFIDSDALTPLSMKGADGKVLTDRYKDSASAAKPYSLVIDRSVTNFLTENLPEDQFRLSLKTPMDVRIEIRGEFAESLIGVTLRDSSGTEIPVREVEDDFVPGTGAPNLDHVAFDATLPKGKSMLELRHLRQGTMSVGVIYDLVVSPRP